ncbi:methylenetetrahydrofolate reductase [NAD(P)H] [Aliirhizobium terrae]|uniref:methylenetetrahydrofolate reductase [NAD(P)H] n=1 Tax=Terrirhizobium terrae TaxID=2926709 RepID=UPI002576A37E|nr:methylenetetrahydrofolate reductase [NAD(P)H] [Rhizobium sp. CC-CFT758]WJH40315.1 methylenetetrahydrofolate reductase [NAD(P)H] [Rhizobium sp. CC-CFT758]
MDEKTTNQRLKISFEFFPPKSEEMEAQLWETVERLALWQPEFVTVTYGAGGSTKEPTLAAVQKIIGDTSLPTAAHLTCVDASKDEVRAVVDEYRAAGVRRIVALRGDPAAGIGTAYAPHPQGFAQTADLVRALADYGDFDISVSAYPEKHPESPDMAADIDVLKRKADAGATRALTQFFFDNDTFFRYMDEVAAAGITLPVIPGIMPIQNLTQLKRFARRCGAVMPGFLDDRFEGLDEKPEERAKVAADVAAEQIEALTRRGFNHIHLYTMNRAPLVSAVLERIGYKPVEAKAVAAA